MLSLIKNKDIRVKTLIMLMLLSEQARGHHVGGPALESHLASFVLLSIFQSHIYEPQATTDAKAERFTDAHRVRLK